MSVPPFQSYRYQHPSRLDGVPALAAFINDDSDAVIFRKFGKLGARNLLHLQNRLCELENQLEKLDKEDADIAKQNHLVRDSAKAYDALRKLAERHHEGPIEASENQQMRELYEHAHIRIELHREISSCLHEYRQALIDEHEIGKLAKPSSPALESFRRFFDTEKDGKILVGDDKEMLRDSEDLVALMSSPDDDRLSQLLRSAFGRCLQDRKRTASQPHSDIYYFPARRVQILSYSVSAILSAVLLVGAMACLGSIMQRSWQLKIGIVALFTFMFAGFVALLTNARRSEVFMATAAYAAVLVVYVSAGAGEVGIKVPGDPNS